MTDTTPLVAARQRMAQAIAERAENALAAMLRNRDPITFAAVAQRAGVSREYLYRHPDLSQRIKHARQAAKPALRSAPDPGDGVIAALRDHIRRQERTHQNAIRQLKSDNADLRRQLQTALGAVISQPPPARCDPAQ